jgi:hypothetical protein
MKHRELNSHGNTHRQARYCGSLQYVYVIAPNRMRKLVGKATITLEPYKARIEMAQHNMASLCPTEFHLVRAVLRTDRRTDGLSR